MKHHFIVSFDSQLKVWNWETELETDLFVDGTVLDTNELRFVRSGSLIESSPNDYDQDELASEILCSYLKLENDLSNPFLVSLRQSIYDWAENQRLGVSRRS